MMTDSGGLYIFDKSSLNPLTVLNLAPNTEVTASGITIYPYRVL